MRKLLYSFLICVVTASQAWSQDSTTTADKSTFTISGYIDTYYFTNFNRPSSRDNMGQSGVGRGFDRRVDQFQLGMVQTILKYTNKKSEMVADLAFGPSAQYGNYGNVPVLAPAYGYAIGNDNFSAILIKQAYFKYNVSDKFNLTLGQFGTHIGYELIDAPLNFHYSINHTFNSGIPFYHTGLKGTYQFSDNVYLMGGIVNGFDYMHDNNRAKGIIGQLFVSPFDGFNVYMNYINTNEANADANGNTPKGNFTVYDINGTLQATERLMLAFWVMLGSQKGEVGAPGTFTPTYGITNQAENWGGANIYATYKFSDLFSLGFRGEYFDNTSGVRGLRNVDLREGVVDPDTGVLTGLPVGTDVSTFTLTGNFTLAGGNILLKPEIRFDNFKKLPGEVNRESQQFMDADGKYTKNAQTTFGAAAIYKF